MKTAHGARVYPRWVCWDCANAARGAVRRDHVEAWHKDTCGVCNLFKAVTEPRDFGYPRFSGFEAPLSERHVASDACWCKPEVSKP